MWAQTPGDIGKIIAAARRHRKLTQAELARTLGTTQGWVSEVEKGKETAHIGKVLRVLSQLGVRLQTGETPWDAAPPPAATDAAARGDTVSLADLLRNLTESRKRAKK